MQGLKEMSVEKRFFAQCAGTEWHSIFPLRVHTEHNATQQIAPEEVGGDK